MPSVILKCPHCGHGITKSMLFDKNGKASRGSGRCPKCHKGIMWWGENNRGKIAKN